MLDETPQSTVNVVVRCARGLPALDAELAMPVRPGLLRGAHPAFSLRMRTQNVHQLPCPPIVLVSSTSPSPRIIIPTASLPLTFFLKVRDKNLVMRICESGITLTTEPRPKLYGLLLSGDRPRTVDHHLMGCTTACLGFLN